MASNQLDDESKQPVPEKLEEKRKPSVKEEGRDSVTGAFLSTLGSARPISQPIQVEDGGRKPKYRTADKYEIPYDPETDKNHPYERFRRNRYFRCLVSREIARYLDRKTFITVSVREALIYSVFLILLSLITFGSFSLEKFYLTEAMIHRYTELEFDIEDYDDHDVFSQDHTRHLTINFHQINTLEDVWFYQYHILHDIIFKPFWNTENKLFENKVMGLPQIRQIRVRNNTCNVLPFLDPNSTIPCYGPYTEEHEEREVIGKPASTLTERLADANIWRSPNETGLMPFYGNLATYSGGGYVAHLYDEDDANQLTAALKSLKWYTRATRAIFIELTIYNGNVNLFCIFKLIFEIPTTGGVLPVSRIYVKKLIRYDSGSDTIILIFEITAMIFVVFYTYQKLLELITLRLKFFKSFWIYIDIMVLIMSYLTFTYNLLLYLEVQEIMPTLLDEEKVDYEFISFDKLLYLHIIYSRCFAILIGFAFLRLLKYFNVVHSMYQLQTTLSRAVPDMLSYFVLFFYFYFVFAIVGLFLFGSELEDFKSFPLALYSLMKYSIADFDYDKLTQVDPVLAPIFFFTYIFMIVLILANIFLAILVSKYQEVRSEVSIGGAKTFIKDMLMIWFLQLLGKMECPWLLSQIEREEFEEKVKSPTEHVRYYLRQAGYSELEIELFFKKYDITDSKIEAMEESRISFKKGEREAPPPLSQKDIMRYIIIQKLEYLEKHYQQANKLIDQFLEKLTKIEKRRATR